MRDKEVFYISPNKLKIWLQCPRKYWHYYLFEPTKYKEPPRPYYTLGEAVHNALNSFFSLVSSIRTKERLLDQFEVYWRAAKNQEGGFKDTVEEKIYKDRAITMLENFYEKEDTNVTPYRLSPNFTKYILLTDKIMLGGKIDRVDLEANKMLHIIDYKTGKEDRDDPHQLPMYDLLVRGWLKKDVSNLSYLHLESGNWSTTPSTYEKRQETKRLIIETVKKIPKDDDKQYFICSLKEKCIHCDYLREIGFEPILN
ncbi:PD-(D/E)XK nuclease family protein [Patescibacteria group bacterium]|nr:PD-(D/E)XK nuclease family protein [Patescibacteria group bacterium]